MLKEITDTINPDVYFKLYYYISEAYDTRLSIVKQIIPELPDFIEKRIKEIEGGQTYTPGPSLNGIPIVPCAKPIDVLY